MSPFWSRKGKQPLGWRVLLPILYQKIICGSNKQGLQRDEALCWGFRGKAPSLTACVICKGFFTLADEGWSQGVREGFYVRTSF